MSQTRKMLKRFFLAPRVSTFFAASAVAFSARAQVPPTPAPQPAPPTAPAPAAEASPPATAVPPATAAPPTAPAAPTASPSAATPTPAEPAAPPASALSASDAQALDALQAEAADTATAGGPTFQLYGFADFTTRFLTRDTLGFEEIGAHSGTMSVGNLNLYGAADLTGGWRSLFEVRFLYLPNGVLDFTTFQRTTTATGDPADDLRPLYWAGIEIQRAYLEYSAHSLLNIRAGEFLTPYGIWNVDHGSPTIIPAAKPYPIGEKFFPDRQTGIEVFGSAPLGDTSLGYHLTLSNGRGSSANYQDLDDNKALGGRLVFTSHPVGTLTLGVSGYYGRSTESSAAIVGTALEQDVTVQFDDFSYAADLLWQWEGLHVQGEVMANDVVYTDEGRPAPAFFGPPTAGLVPDHRRIGYYGLVGYRTPWLTLMPFLLGEYEHAGMKVGTGGAFGGGAGALSFGLNARPIPAVALKAQFRHIFFVNEGTPASYLDDILLSAAWSF
jgi:hypothetical protein